MTKSECRMTKEIHGRHRGRPFKSRDLLFGGFGRRRTHLCSFRKRVISRATRSAGKSSINAVRFCFPEIGGTKNRGRVLSGTCSWRMANWFAHTKHPALGKSTGFMTESENSTPHLNPLLFRRGEEAKLRQAMGFLTNQLPTPHPLNNASPTPVRLAPRTSTTST